MFNDDAHIAAMERVAAFNLADPKGRMDNKVLMGWLASQTDMVAEDWVILND